MNLKADSSLEPADERLTLTLSYRILGRELLHGMQTFDLLKLGHNKLVFFPAGKFAVISYTTIGN